MRFDAITARGLGPFRDEVRLDFASLTGLLIAVTGANGAGKSTLLELLAGALYRECPTRGSLSALATARDAFVEVSCTNGRPWRIRQSVDALSAKGEALVLDESGAPALPDTKVRSFDSWAAAHLPPSEVLYASTFGVQGAAGFLSARPAERKAILLGVLGIERLERLADAARGRARATQEELATVRARCEELARSAVSVEDATAHLAAMHASLVAHEVALREAHARHDELVVKASRIEAHRAAVSAARSARRDLEQRIRVEEQALDALRLREQNNRALLDRADELRAAAHEAAALREGLAELEAAGREAAGRAKLLAEREVRLERERDELRRRRHGLVAPRWASSSTPEAVREAVRIEPGARARVADLVAAADEAQRRRDSLRVAASGSSADRISRLRDALGDIASWRADCHAHDADKGNELRDFDEVDLVHVEWHAAWALEVDDGAKGVAEDARAALDAAEYEAAAAARALSDAREALVAVEHAVALLPLLTEHEAACAAVERERGVVEASVAEAERAVVVVREERELAVEQRDEVYLEQRRTREALERFESLPAQLARLDAAEGRLAELEPQIADALARIVGLRDALDDIPEPGPVPAIPDIDESARAARTAGTLFAEARAAVARAETDLERARIDAERGGELAAEARRLEIDLADWTRLAADLGRDGLQAMEIDAAGPELSALINDLLHTCVGPRWTVTIDTTRLSADGKRSIEGLEVRVLDTERGREAPAETFSGGERVIIGEAVSLALSMLATRRASLVGVTLVRDESGAALDAAGARAYVAMLRRAAELVGASRVLLVSHSPDVVEMCDARVEVAGGRVEVRA